MGEIVHIQPADPPLLNDRGNLLHHCIQCLYQSIATGYETFLQTQYIVHVERVFNYKLFWTGRVVEHAPVILLKGSIFLKNRHFLFKKCFIN